MSWAMMSRPVPHSTPSGCAALMPPQSRFGLPTQVADRGGVQLVWIDAKGAGDDRAEDPDDVEHDKDDQADHRHLVPAQARPDDLAEASAARKGAALEAGSRVLNRCHGVE